MTRARTIRSYKPRRPPERNPFSGLAKDLRLIRPSASGETHQHTALLKRAALTRRCARQTAFALIIVVFVSMMSGKAAAQAASEFSPTVIFTLDFPASNPTHYSITVDSKGHATYECSVKIEDTTDPETYRTEFQVTSPDRDHIFQWAKQAKYFSAKIDSGNNKIAFTGDKTLAYRDGQQSPSAHYNYSSVEPVRQLTALFQNLQVTLDYGRRLAFFHRYQKLALDEELKHMETQARNNELSEIQAVSPTLQQIIDDTSVISVARARAKELILMVK